MAATVTVLFVSYLLGSTPSAIWVGVLWESMYVNTEVEMQATNTFRVLGVPFGVMVLY